MSDFTSEKELIYYVKASPDNWVQRGSLIPEHFINGQMRYRDGLPATLLSSGFRCYKKLGKDHGVEPVNQFETQEEILSFLEADPRNTIKINGYDPKDSVGRSHFANKVNGIWNGHRYRLKNSKTWEVADNYSHPKRANFTQPPLDTQEAREAAMRLGFVLQDRAMDLHRYSNGRFEFSPQNSGCWAVVSSIDRYAPYRVVNRHFFKGEIMEEKEVVKEMTREEALNYMLNSPENIVEVGTNTFSQWRMDNEEGLQFRYHTGEWIPAAKSMKEFLCQTSYRKYVEKEETVEELVQQLKGKVCEASFPIIEKLVKKLEKNNVVK